MIDRIHPVGRGLRLISRSAGSKITLSLDGLLHTEDTMPPGRTRIATGIYRDRFGFEIAVKRGGKTHVERAARNTPKAELIRRRIELLRTVLKSDPAAAPKGTLTRAIVRYTHLAKHLVGWQEQRAHLRAFIPMLGLKDRAAITRDMLLVLRSAWAAAGVKPKTINNRFSALRALYHTLDGPDAPTPADRLRPLKGHRTPAVAVRPERIIAVDQRLQEFERSGRLRNQKTRARFRVRASTGRRPSEIMRAEPADVDRDRRLWTPRDGKGGFTPGIYLTDDMLEAWALFFEADAWGPFDTGSQAEVLRAAGWPDDVRPYNLRHSVGIALSEAGVDLADVQQIMGHKDQRTTRQHYVPVLATRLQQAMARLEGRLTWEPLPSTPTVPRNGTERFSVEKNGKQRRRAVPRKGAKHA